MIRVWKAEKTAINQANFESKTSVMSSVHLVLLKVRESSNNEKT
jgi:hypothetical protein